MDVNDQRELYFVLRRFVRFYEFLLQVSSFNDVDLHKKYNFIVWLLPYLKIGKPGDGFNLKGMIQATNFYQRKTLKSRLERLIRIHMSTCQRPRRLILLKTKSRDFPTSSRK